MAVVALLWVIGAQSVGLVLSIGLTSIFRITFSNTMGYQQYFSVANII